MKALDFLTNLSAKNITVSVDGDELLVEAKNKNDLTNDLILQIKTFKPQIIELLTKSAKFEAARLSPETVSQINDKFKKLDDAKRNNIYSHTWSRATL